MVVKDGFLQMCVFDYSLDGGLVSHGGVESMLNHTNSRITKLQTTYLVGVIDLRNYFCLLEG